MDTTRAENGGSAPRSSVPSSSDLSPDRESAGIKIRPDGRQLAIVLADTDSSRSHASDGDSDGESGDDGAEESGESTSKRGRIEDFGPSPRRRLRHLLHAMDRQEDALFLSLTWHEVMPSPGEAKAALNRFSMKFSRRFPGGSYIWKLEPQERGFPHFHLFVYGVPWVDPQKLSELWHECTDEASEQHRKSGVDVEWVRDDGKVQAYLAEYFDKMGKFQFGNEEEPWDWPGRFWGVCMRENLPYAEWSDWQKHLEVREAISLIEDLLDSWDVDIPDGVVPPTLMIDTRGDPANRLDSLLDRLGELMG
jgi:hypothetical protein